MMTTVETENDFDASDESIALSTLLKDLNVDFDPIDSENFDIIAYINEVGY